ncbi:hypothetical protein [Geobacillus sp. C56-T3]|uniref:hypothetical protein n=1 Tax=Geobacillus sp. (strain C56-T3) TaxID=691437 RepID=UPI0002F14A36|nr:hypothetical protein [Geobacillus sp. C56-T3]
MPFETLTFTLFYGASRYLIDCRVTEPYRFQTDAWICETVGCSVFRRVKACRRQSEK